MRILLITILFIIGSMANADAQKPIVTKTEPPNWWSNMQNDTLQIMLYGNNLENAIATSKTKNISIISSLFNQTNYGFIDVVIDKNFTETEIVFEIKNDNKTEKINYPILKRDAEFKPKGVNNSDVVYLIMPDRFANGNELNDDVSEMEQTKAAAIDGRKGGDLQGIIKNLPYIKELGATSIWLTPFQEMNQASGSYHHYGMSDMYNVDARFGNGNKFSKENNLVYKKLVESAHANNLKMVMDVVLNHIGINHPWMQKTPRLKNWVHDSTLCNFMIPALTDKYATEYDKNKMEKAWFVPSMPDLNHDNDRLCKYLIQNNIWWIEFAQLDAIRLDTQPFSKKEFLTQWASALKNEYPTLTIVGETWSAINSPNYTKYWQANNNNADAYNSNIESVMDFPFFENTIDALKNNNANKLYYTLAQDFINDNADKNWIFMGNHDTERFYTAVGNDVKKYAIGIILLATMRGIPQIYYGDEIMASGKKGVNDGYMRATMPGGWKADAKNIFTKKGYTNADLAIQMLEFNKQLFNWRKTKTVLHTGKLQHFIPINNVYSYVRYNETEAVMTLINCSNKEVTINLNTENYLNILNNYKSLNLKFSNIITDNNTITLAPNTAEIIECSN